MDTKKVIVTLLVLTLVLSTLTVAFNAFSGKKTVVVDNRKGTDQATVGLYVEGGEQPSRQINENANVGLYVNG